VFIASLIPGAIAVLILIFVVKVVIKKHPTANIFANMKQVVHRNRPFVMLLIISCIFSLGTFNFSFVLLKASDIGVEKNFIPIVYAVINIAHTIIGVPSGFLADKIGKEKVLLIGYGVFGISSVLMVILSGNALYAYLLAGVFGVYMGISETVQRAVIPRYVSSELRGTAFGIFSIVIGAGFFVGNVLFGFLWDNSGLTSAVMYSVILTLIAMCSMIGFLRKYPERAADVLPIAGPLVAFLDLISRNEAAMSQQGEEHVWIPSRSALQPYEPLFLPSGAFSFLFYQALLKHQ